MNQIPGNMPSKKSCLPSFFSKKQPAAQQFGGGVVPGAGPAMSPPIVAAVLTPIEATVVDKLKTFPHERPTSTKTTYNLTMGTTHTEITSSRI